MLWRVRGRERQVYGFEYDAYDRLTKADYIDYSDSGGTSSNNRFGITYSYDVRGNISSITRNGQYWDGSCWQVEVIVKSARASVSYIPKPLSDSCSGNWLAYEYQVSCHCLATDSIYLLTTIKSIYPSTPLFE